LPLTRNGDLDACLVFVRSKQPFDGDFNTVRPPDPECTLVMGSGPADCH
jgi:hypothetical protein